MTPALPLALARAVLQRALDLAGAADAGRPVCVAVCDAQGFLVCFARSDRAPVRSIELAQGKAYSAARMGVTTSAFLERTHRERIEPGYFCDPRLTALPGGGVVRDGTGMVIGGVGVSGLTSREDQLVADQAAVVTG
ncbi:heme-binding protein [Acidiphilium acidophilum]|uniref:GlcG/HbpS family heme-binding protein n=1 Tax=Acidiphilium acidophilum TaxID=76588 RepID=UPI002E8E67E8|nr:heme-binding protein [Acidiphilium acidophilum]